MIGIYKITSPSGYVYIGQSWDIKTRWRGYRKPSERRRQPFVDASILKHGLAAHKFEIIHRIAGFVTQRELDRLEQRYMNLYRGWGYKLMNVREAGSRGCLPQSARDKIGAKQRGRKMSTEARKRMSLAGRGRQKTPEHKARIGLAHKGREQFIKAFRGENNPKVKLTPVQVSEIRARHIPRQKKCNKRLAAEYGVSISTIERVTGRGKGGTWLHL